jgi:hypothetical protein
MGVRPKVPPRSEEPTRVFDDGPPPERELWPWLVVVLVLALAGAASAWLVTRTGGSSATPKTTTPVAPPPPAAPLPARTVTVQATRSEKPSTLPTIPRVVGEDEGTAKQELHDAGFGVKVERRDTPDPAQDKIVLGEQPAGGTHAPAKTKVTIYVGHRHGGSRGK